MMAPGRSFWVHLGIPREGQPWDWRGRLHPSLPVSVPVVVWIFTYQALYHAFHRALGRSALGTAGSLLLTGLVGVAEILLSHAAIAVLGRLWSARNRREPTTPE